MNIAFGIHTVEALLKESDQVQALWIDDSQRPNPRLAKLIDQAKRSRIKIERHTRQALDELAQGERHQGVIAVLQERHVQHQSLESLLAGLDHDPFLLILDGVTDPHNLGACMRSANAAGVDAVIVPKDNAVGITPVVRKVACGAAEVTPFYQVTNLARTLRDLQQAGVWIMGAAGETETSIYEADLKGPLALVMGAEGKGLRRLTREHCDLLIKIPMAGTVESLNVSVATGICLFEAQRQRCG